MYVYGLSRKQCGVIFANIKNGNLSLCEDFAKWMYSNVSEAKVFIDSPMKDVFDRMKIGLDLVFSRDYYAAADELMSAYKKFSVCYC